MNARKPTVTLVLVACLQLYVTVHKISATDCPHLLTPTMLLGST